MKTILRTAGIFCLCGWFSTIRCVGKEMLEESHAREILRNFTTVGEPIFAKVSMSHWNYFTNLTRENKDAIGSAAGPYSSLLARTKFKINEFDLSLLEDGTRFQLEKIQRETALPVSSDDLRLFHDALDEMGERYSTASVCRDGKCYRFDPDLEELMATSRDDKELLWAWKGWRDAVANETTRQNYITYVQVLRRGYEDAGEERWLQRHYHGQDVKKEVARIWQEIRPLFRNLHAYVRRKLFNFYGEDLINITGPIPSHLLGNVHTRAWTNIMDIVAPYPEVNINYTELIKAKGLTGVQMARMADDFYRSLGMIPVSERFFNDSMFERPNDGREVVCYPASSDFFNRVDVRLKMCTDQLLEDFIMIQHEMGHIQYFMQYKDLSLPLRTSPNPGFHEAIGDTILLSTMTSEHLYSIGLLDEPPIESHETEINYLMQMALENVAFMPFAYLVDLYRWKLFDGSIPIDTMNREWWRLRLELEGISPPIERGEDYVDAASFFHVAYDVPHIRYFFSRVLIFQFHKALCDEAQHEGPLHKCDINGSIEAGRLFSKMLSVGGSYPWDETLEIITGKREMSLEPFLEYFKPLEDWLIAENEKNGDVVGWGVNGTPLSATLTTIGSFLCLLINVAMAIVIRQ